ncbi:MAG: replicative DNA helicase [Pseudomonadota bacterium]|nr:replicative DNA helicase [Pseudomonadota bacterium]
MANTGNSKNLAKIVSKKNLSLMREVPMNLGAEQALLGAILSNNLAFEKIENFLEPEFFSSKINKTIFNTIRKLITNDQIADLNTVKVQLDGDDEFIKNGGLSYLLKICENTISIINSKQYGELIHDLFLRRRLIDLGTDLINESYLTNDENTSFNLIERTEHNLFSLTNNNDLNSGPKDFGDIIVRTLDYAEKAYQKSDEVIGLKTGLKDFDKKIGGLHKSDLIIIAGRPSMGKTAFATNIASNISKSTEEKESKKKNVLFFSLEMSSEQLATRLVGELAELSSENIRTGNLSKSDFSKLVKSSENLKNLNLFIDDSPALTISSIRTRARRLKRKNGLDLLILDYLQLVNGESKYNENRVQEISDITRGLKAIAKEFDIPVIALSQLSRKVEDREEKRPQLSDLRESGAIEQDADLVVFLYREEYYLARTEPQEGTEKHEIWTSKMEKVHNIAEAIIAKHRHGPISKVKLHFNPSWTKFSDLAESSIY